ncbi:MAG: ribonuclease III [Deltaproteobacteria bacterium]|jgi:ribonuclease-3|nr:ribonuclease III [Deltaproteobacteria bacterium]
MTSNFHQEPLNISGLMAVLGVKFNDLDLLELAMTHPSVSGEAAGRENQRLEFLGDSVLGLYVSELIYRLRPGFSEGQMSKARASVVNEKTLAMVARKLDVGSYLRLGPGEQASGGRNKPSILADGLEAVLGAIYLSNGPATARRFVWRLWTPLVQKINLTDSLTADYKSRLQELTQGLGLGLPGYLLVRKSGPDNDPVFTMEISVPGRKSLRAAGRTKKEASQQAAKAMLAQIQEKNV